MQFGRIDISLLQEWIGRNYPFHLVYGSDEYWNVESIGIMDRFAELFRESSWIPLCCLEDDVSTLDVCLDVPVS